jgi:putative tryptophan/tyrosine transport system substrate-binding protein
MRQRDHRWLPFMKRRALIAFLAGVVAFPTIANAQLAKERRIGVLSAFAESDAAVRSFFAAFRERLEKLGWQSGRDIEIEYRWAAGDIDRLQALAKELVGNRPDVLVAVTTPAVAALLAETRTLPIIFAGVTDPVANGFVASLARPGGNATGFIAINVEASLGGKWVELSKELMPTVQRVVMIYNPAAAPFADYYLRPFEAAGQALTVETKAVAVGSEAEIDSAIGDLAREPSAILVVLPDAFTATHRDVIVSSARRHHVPAVCPYRFFAEAGCPLSYGNVGVDMFLGAASYVDRVLRGAKPADLPVQAPTRFEMIINLKAAKALGLAIAPSILVRADEVIE